MRYRNLFLTCLPRVLKSFSWLILLKKYAANRHYFKFYFNEDKLNELKQKHDVLLHAILWYASNEPLDLCSDFDSTSQVETIMQVKWLVSYDFWYLWRIRSATLLLCKKSIMPLGQKTSHAAREHFWATPWCVPEDGGPEWERRGWWRLLLAFFYMNKCLAMSTD